jgi:hypothetical protein
MPLRNASDHVAVASVDGLSVKQRVSPVPTMGIEVHDPFDDVPVAVRSSAWERATVLGPDSN